MSTGNVLVRMFHHFKLTLTLASQFTQKTLNSSVWLCPSFSLSTAQPLNLPFGKCPFCVLPLSERLRMLKTAEPIFSTPCLQGARPMAVSSCSSDFLDRWLSVLELRLELIVSLRVTVVPTNPSQDLLNPIITFKLFHSSYHT
jgi:hypothetical protein